ncbi:hypothetical protein EMPS_07601 [Entomortierella parvispora]|uniref:Uncharacterized protein n=1 Tax=Entomortierella parvispora TaxID=205924 RepID=A0A9P3HF81_9FUNG|nr:hypothetical protein EMPS_07601 [Entomortierella parvispora]
MPSHYNYKSSSHTLHRSSRRRYHKSSRPRQPPNLPLEIWFQILTQTLNLLLPISTTPRTYSTYILPLLLTSHTFHEHCHPVTYPHLRKHRLLQLFTRWKAAHSREVHFYHHPLSVRVRYALPDRVGNPPGEEYETLYSFIKRAYLFGCESVCGTVIPVEGGLEGVTAAAAAAVPTNGAQAQGQAQNAAGNGAGAEGAAGAAAPANAAAATTSVPASAATGATTPGNVVVAPPVAPTAAPVAIQQGGDGGGQGWKGHALQWHVANPTFAAEGTIDLYRDVVEEYRRVVCGSAASRERSRQLEQTLDRIKNPHRYPALASPTFSSASESTFSQDSAALSRRTSETSDDTALEGDTENMDEDDDEEEEEEEDSDCDYDEDDVEEEEEEEDESHRVDLVQESGQEMIEQDQDLLLNEIEAKGGLRRRDSGHGQSSSEMDIDEDADDELDHEDMVLDSDMEPRRALTRASSSKSSRVASHNSSNGESDPHQQPPSPRQQCRTKRTNGKREPDTMAMDYELEGAVTSRQRRGGLRSQTQHQQKMERSHSASEQERIIMDMSLDKPYHAMGSHSLSPFHPLERPTSAGSSSSASSSSIPTSFPAFPFSSTPPLGPISMMVKERLMRTKSSPRLALQRSLSSPGSADSTKKSVASPLSSSLSSSGSTTRLGQQETTPLSPSSCATSESPISNTVDTVSSTASSSGPLKAEDLGFDLASACANTFASDLAFVLARVPGLGAHFHRFEQLAKLKLHVGWAKHAQSRGGNDVFVMSCSRLIAILAPLANTPLVSERGGGLPP